MGGGACPPVRPQRSAEGRVCACACQGPRGGERGPREAAAGRLVACAVRVHLTGAAAARGRSLPGAADLSGLILVGCLVLVSRVAGLVLVGCRGPGRACRVNLTLNLVILAIEPEPVT